MSGSSRLREIPSLAVPGSSAGSLVVADSFLFGSANGKGAVRILTATVPYVCTWLGMGKEENHAASILRQVADPSEDAVASVLGKLVWNRPSSAAVGADRDDSGPITLDPCTMVLSGASEYMQCVSGTMKIFQRGGVFDHPRFGPLVLSFSRAARIGVYEPNPTDPMLISVHLTPASGQLYGLVPAERLQSSRDVLHVGIIVKGGTKSPFFREVMPVWKESWDDCGLTVENLDAPPDTMALAFSKCGTTCSCTDLGAELRASPSGSRHSDRSVYVHASSLSEFCAGPVEAGAEADVSARSSPPKLTGGTSTLTPLTVVCGVPGSSHSVVARSLMAFSKSAEWTEVQLPPSEQDEAADLSGLVAAAKSATSANSRILLSTEGYVDIVSLTSAITLHPELAGLCRIGSVVAVVKPTNFSIRRDGEISTKFSGEAEEQFSESTAVLPMLLDQCAWGWTHAIVILGSSASVQNELQSRLSLVNPDATIVRGAYTMQSDIATVDSDRTRAAEACLGMLSADELETILATDAFETDSMKRIRASVAPNWPRVETVDGRVAPVPERLAFDFTPVLDRSRLRKSMQTLLDFKADEKWPAPPPQVLFCRVVAVTEDSGGKRAAISFTVAESDVSIVDGAGSGSVVLYGENLHQHAEWLKRRLLECRPPMPALLKPIASFEQLPSEQLRDIQDTMLAENPDRELPDGTFYDGQMYIDFDGNRSVWHPAMAQWCSDAVAQGNDKITAKNADIKTTIERYRSEEERTMC